MSARWILRTRAKRGRCHFLKDYTSAGPHAYRLEWCNGTHADALAFTRRADAAAFASDMRLNGVRTRLVPHNTEKTVRESGAYKPRGLVIPTPDEAAKLTAAVDAARERARAVALDLPEFAVHVTALRRSCRGGRKDGKYFITIDRWAINSDKPGYLTYIVAHELAHVADVLHHGRTSHGPLFMSMLMMLCPPELRAYELNYKPTAAYAAGIRLSDASAEVRAAIRPPRAPAPRVSLDALIAQLVARDNLKPEEK